MNLKDVIEQAEILFDHWDDLTDHCLVCGDFLEHGNDTGICFACELDDGLSDGFLEDCDELSVGIGGEEK